MHTKSIIPLGEAQEPEQIAGDYIKKGHLPRYPYKNFFVPHFSVSLTFMARYLSYIHIYVLQIFQENPHTY
jgi:hypothetical protein